MGQPTSLLGQARAFARDFPRDRMPQGYLWDVLDYVPTIIDAALTGRGGWLWGSTPAMAGDPESGYYAPFLSGDKLLVQSTGGHLYDVSLVAPYTATDKGVIPRARQNPVQLGDQVIAFDTARAQTPRLISAPGGVVGVTGLNAAHKFSPIGTVYKSMLVTAGAPGEESLIRFSVPGQDLTTAPSFDVNSFQPSNLPVTALAALRSMILVFHGGSVERIRGTLPPSSTSSSPKGDMFRETVFDRQGCLDPQTLAFWNDNCIFADEHGVHMTDGSVIRNLVSQGAILYYWRTLYQNKQTLCAGTFLDYYIITIRRSDGIVDTLICDLVKRQWFRFSNLPALCYIASSGGTGMERIFAGLAGKGRLARIGPCFFPVETTAQVADDDGTLVLPRFETPWYRMGQEGRKRARFAYLSYDARAVGVAPNRTKDGEGEPDLDPGLFGVVVDQLMKVGYIRNPQQLVYTDLGSLPSTNGYERYRLPLGQNPYGVAFHVEQLLPSTVTRIFDIAVEAQPGERSRT